MKPSGGVDILALTGISVGYWAIGNSLFFENLACHLFYLVRLPNRGVVSSMRCSYLGEFVKHLGCRSSGQAHCLVQQSESARGMYVSYLFQHQLVECTRNVLYFNETQTDEL